jgi:TonB family protein
MKIMISENLIFKSAFMVSAVIHLAGFGFFLGGQAEQFKNGLIPNDSRVTVYEIGFIENVSSNENKSVGQLVVNKDSEGIIKDVDNKESFSGGEGSSGDFQEPAGGLREQYLLKVRKRIEEFKFYPEEVRRRHLNGSIKLSFFIDENGFVKDLKVVESSGYFILDNAGKDSILKAGPFPKPPRMDLGNIQTTLVFKIYT